MNTLVITVTAAAAFLGAYHVYAKRIADIWQINPDRPTPAGVRHDGVDFVPSRHWLILFGHHFASIAGAGPIIGPVVAVCFWGWLPALLWVILGSIFWGGIHDFGSLMISIREDGATIGEAAAKCISRKAKWIFLVFTWLALVLVIAVFAYLAADTFVTQPKIVIPSLGIIPVAVLTGLALYRWKWHAVPVTLAGLLCLAGLIFLGSRFPVVPGGHTQFLWLVVLFVYCYAASILPVNVLLQPRDYLSSFLLVGGLAAAVLGIVVHHPQAHTPSFIANKSALGYLWPMMFITIACGANSGFHSLIASGTTSRQLASERHAKAIGFGAMLLEGFLAVVVIMLITGGLTSEEFQRHLIARTSPVTLYGMGFGSMTASFFGPWGTFLALMVLNAFILTTLDSATRISRYIAEEMTGVKNRYLSTAVIVAMSGCLAMGKDSANTPIWQNIWPAFGASNQLVAALALIVISCWLLRKGKPTFYALVPAVFMLVTSIAALGIQMVRYWQSADVLLLIISAVLMTAAGFLVKEAAGVVFQEKAKE